MKNNRNFVVSTFNEIASIYDLMNHLLSGGLDLYWRFVAGKLTKGNTLDICTGKGEMVSQIEKNNNKLVVGIDFSMEMLKRFKYLHPDAFVIKGDAQKLPVKDNLFETVVCTFGIRNINDRESMLKNIYRTLKPGGRIVILELTLPDSPIRWIFTLYLKTALPLFGHLIAKNRKAYEYLKDSIFHFDRQKKAILKYMKIAGFRNLEIKKLSMGTATLFIGEKGR